MPVSIVPAEIGNTVYQVLDDLGNVRVWHEITENEANEATIIRWIVEGQFKRLVRVVAYNTDEGWSRDVSREIALQLLDLSREGNTLDASTTEFVERLTGRSPTVAV